MNEYSQTRDRLFREKYPTIQLDILGKEDYLQIKNDYKDLIEYWE